MALHCPSKREWIYRRDGGRCVYCGSVEDLTLDHIKPRSQGGTNKRANLVTACYGCNSDRGDRRPFHLRPDVEQATIDAITAVLGKPPFVLQWKPTERLDRNGPNGDFRDCLWWEMVFKRGLTTVTATHPRSGKKVGGVVIGDFNGYRRQVETELFFRVRSA